MNNYEQELKNKKEQALEMFFLSVDKDIQNWKKGNKIYYSKNYQKSEFETGISFKIEKNTIYLTGRTGSLEILRYNRFNFKIYKYVKKIKTYFKNMERNNKILGEISFIEKELIKIESNFHTALRYKKLKNLKNDN